MNHAREALHEPAIATVGKYRKRERRCKLAG